MRMVCFDLALHSQFLRLENEESVMVIVKCDVKEEVPGGSGDYQILASRRSKVH